MEIDLSSETKVGNALIVSRVSSNLLRDRTFDSWLSFMVHFIFREEFLWTMACQYSSTTRGRSSKTSSTRPWRNWAARTLGQTTSTIHPVWLTIDQFTVSTPERFLAFVLRSKCARYDADRSEKKSAPETYSETSLAANASRNAFPTN